MSKRLSLRQIYLAIKKKKYDTKYDRAYLYIFKKVHFFLYNFLYNTYCII